MCECLCVHESKSVECKTGFMSPDCVNHASVCECNIVCYEYACICILYILVRAFVASVLECNIVCYEYDCMCILYF